MTSTRTGTITRAMTFLYVACGGALGAVLRYGATLWIRAPLGVLCVNVLGSFLIGLAFVLLTQGRGAHAFIVVGTLGGFTTFSSFSLDALRLFEAGQIALAGAYVMGTVVLCLAAVALGVMFGRALA